MDKKKKHLIPQTEREKILDALFGSSLEMTEDIADEILGTAGIKTSDLVSKLKSKLDEKARKIRLEGRTVPTPLQNALENLRAATSKSQSQPDVDPDDWVAGLFSSDTNAWGNTSNTLSSFRGRKSGETVSAKDKELLESLQADVEEEGKE